MRRFATCVVMIGLLACLAPAMAQADDKPRIAVLEFVNKADSGWGWWNQRGAAAMQDVFVTTLLKGGKFRVIERERLSALMAEKNLSLSGDVSTETAIQAGRLLGVEYFLVGSVTEYGKTDVSGRARKLGGLRGLSGKRSKFVGAANARLINTETGEIIWADEAREEHANYRLFVDGFGGGVDRDQRMFDKVMKPIVEQLTQSLMAKDL